MKKKNGFVFMETILTVVILTTTLVVLYADFSSGVISEKRRLYYDDISAVYKTLAIRDAFDRSVNAAKFRVAVANAQTNYYFYMFGPNSDIFYDNTLMNQARELYNYKVLIYVPFTLFSSLKTCTNTQNTRDVKCKNTLNQLDAYADATFTDYLKTVNIDRAAVSSRPEIQGILIALIYESKDGNEEVMKNGYQSCLQKKIFEHYNVTNRSEAEKQAKIKEYYATPGLSFNMHCENAYYNSWVYL